MPTLKKILLWGGICAVTIGTLSALLWETSTGFPLGGVAAALIGGSMSSRK